MVWCDGAQAEPQAWGDLHTEIAAALWKAHGGGGAPSIDSPDAAPYITATWRIASMVAEQVEQGFAS